MSEHSFLGAFDLRYNERELGKDYGIKESSNSILYFI